MCTASEGKMTMAVNPSNKEMDISTKSHVTICPSPKTKPRANLWTLKVAQEHLWRLSFLLMGLIVVVPKSIVPIMFSSGYNPPSMETNFHNFEVFELIMTCLTFLLVVWLYEEVSLAILRTKLPPGVLGTPILGDIVPFITSGPNYLRQMRQQLGSNIFTVNIFEPTVVFGEAPAIAWLLHMERKGKIEANGQPHL